MLLFKITIEEKSLKVEYILEYYSWIVYIQTLITMEETEEHFDIFFRRKPALILVSLRRMTRARYASILAKEANCTYSHAVKILQSLGNLGLINFEKKGRVKLVKLTKKGQEIADNIENIRKLIG